MPSGRTEVRLPSPEKSLAGDFLATQDNGRASEPPLQMRLNRRPSRLRGGPMRPPYLWIRLRFAPSLLLALVMTVRWAQADTCINYSTYLHSLGLLKTTSILRSVEVSGSLAYVAADSSGLLVIDVSDPGSPAIIGSVETKGPARDVKLAGNIAYVAASD